MNVKLFFSLMLVALFASVAPAHAAGTLPNEDGIYEGFFGHPLLASEGWEAVGGKWDGLNLIGQSVMQNLGNITDSDPGNASSTGNLADADLILGQTIVMKQKDAANQLLTGGVKIGFAISTSGNDFSVLTADVLKMFIVYFYKNGELVYTKNASSEELDVLNLNLISIGGQGIQTLTVTSPETNDDGTPFSFDSFGFGIGGVSADVIAKIGVHYAFIDEFEESPIIKKYFPNASSSVAGMVTGGANLTNNNLNDGATTAVLNIGGAYYTVNAGEKLPYGAEVGFVISSGSLLDLNLGKAMEVVFIDKDGNELSKTTQVDVVGVELIGGGKAGVNMVIPTAAELDGKEVWGLKLRRISAVNLDLGATVVHYAYVKLPKKKNPAYPFIVTMDVIPSSKYTYKSLGIVKNQNTYSNKVLLKNDPELPISFNDIPADTGDKSSYWNYSATTWKTGVLNEWDVELTVAQTNYNETTGEITYNTVGYIQICRETHIGGSMKYKWYFAKDNQTYASGENGTLTYDSETGVIDLSSIVVTLESSTENVEDGMQLSKSYGLYFNQDDAKDPANGFELSLDEVTMPSIKPEYEIAGSETRGSLEAFDGSDIAGNSTESLVKADAYADYLILSIPEMIDWKTRPASLEIFSEGTSVNTLSFDPASQKWSASSGNIIGQIHDNGLYKLVVMTVSPQYTTGIIGGGKFKAQSFRIVCECALRDEYKTYLEGEYGADNQAMISAADAQKEYGTPATSTAERTLPSISDTDCALRWRTSDQTVLAISSVAISLNDANAGHLAAYPDESARGLLVNQWIGIDLNAAAMAAAETTPMYRHVNYITGIDADNLSAGDYIAEPDNAVIGMSYTTAHSGLGKDVVMNADAPFLTRAYIPVVPSGFTATEGAGNYIEPTYLVVEKQNQAHAGEDLTTGIDSLQNDDTEAEFYNLQGVRVTDPEHGIYIMRKGNRACKIML